MRNTRLTSLMLSLIAGFLILIYFFGPVLFHPNDYLLSPGGDGLKNYYTPAWYLKYDQGLHFTGMNYPFGEHITYTDNQPAISLIFNFIDERITPIHNQTTGIFNILMILSVLACIPLLFSILRYYALPSWYAGISALIITFLSPQIARMGGHYALAYPVFFPLCWYLWIKAKKHHGTVWTSLLIISVIFFGLIHLYYLLIAAMFFSLTGLFLFLKSRNQRVSIHSSLKAFAVAIIPLITVILFIKLSDHIGDRPPTPYGFFRYKASFESIFLPIYSPFLDIWNSFIKVRATNFEGQAYVGFAGLLALIFTVWIALYKLIKRKPLNSLISNMPTDLAIILTSATFVLLFSMAIPFKFGLQFLLDWIPGLKQFRSPGRFAWVFYYVFTVYTAFILYRQFRFFRIRRKTVIAGVMLFLVLASWSADAYINMKNITNYVVKNQYPNIFRSENDEYSEWLDSVGKSAGDFQCILALPYYLMGSEKLYITRSTESISQGMKASYDLGLPLMHGMMSRTSLGQTYQMAGMLSNPLLPKPLLDKFDERPVLLLCTEEKLSPAEGRLRDLATEIGSVDRIRLFELPVSAFRDTVDQFIASFASEKDSLWYKAGSKFLSDSNSLFIHEGFENGSVEGSLEGNGMAYQERGPLWLYKAKNTFSDTGMYNFSIWAKAYPHTTAFPIVDIFTIDKEGNRTLRTTLNPKESTEIFEDWVRVDADLALSPQDDTLELVAFKEYMGFDQLLIKPADLDIVHDYENNDHFWYNNFPVMRQD